MKIEVEILEIVLVFSILNNWYITCRRFTKLRIFNTFDYKYRQNLVSKTTNSDKSQTPQFRETAVGRSVFFFWSCNNSKPAWYNSKPAWHNSKPAWHNSKTACYNSFRGCYISFRSCYNSFCGRYISFRGCYISFRGCYISFCGRYISFRGCYISFCGRYISFRGCYISFRSCYNSFCSWIVLTCVFSLHQTDAQRFAASGSGVICSLTTTNIPNNWKRKLFCKKKDFHRSFINKSQA